MSSLDTRSTSRRAEFGIIAAGFLGLGLALGLRVAIAGQAGAQSVPGGLAFGVALLAVALALGMRRPTFGRRQLGWGVTGAVVLCVPALIAGLGEPAVATPDGAFPVWAAVVTLVAVAEELLLRGVLFDAITAWRGQAAAIAITAVAFGLLHVPLYGWDVLMLDIAVGVFLGVLRVIAGSVTAPALTHVLADLAGWWLR